MAQPGVGAGSRRPATIGDVQRSNLARSSTTRCHSVGLQPCVAFDERCVLAQVHERGESFEAETRDERAVGITPHEPSVDGVAEDALGDGRGRRHAHDGADVALAEGREDALHDGNELGALGPVRKHGDREVEHRRPVVERPGHALVARDLQERIRVLRHGGAR